MVIVVPGIRQTRRGDEWNGGIACIKHKILTAKYINKIYLLAEFPIDINIKLK